MKKIINGKKYDTETAKLLATSTRGNGFDYCREELYRKRTGEFFIFGEGGAYTEYASHPELNCWGPGEKFIPLTEEKARKWAESYLEVDEYEKIFGIVEE